MTNLTEQLKKNKLVIVDEPYHKWSEVCYILRKENIQLKELLRRARKYLSEQETPYSLIKKIDEALNEQRT